ncbi:MAG TPA: hypothetical protein VGK96_09965 [Candidatus Sulfotelmatobacter sp.]
MSKNLVAAAIIVLVLGTAALAQKPSPKPTHPLRPNTNAPTKVIGEVLRPTPACSTGTSRSAPAKSPKTEAT